MIEPPPAARARLSWAAPGDLSAFLGLTVGCARCHNHKFDPIPQTDYYAIKACLAGVQHGERKLRTPELVAREKELGLSREQLAQLFDRVIGIERGDGNFRSDEAVLFLVGSQFLPVAI